MSGPTCQGAQFCENEFMLKGTGSIATFEARNVMVWILLSFQGGFVNAYAFAVGGRFVSHVTGYGTSLGLALQNGNTSQLALLSSIPFAFFLGAAVSGLLVDRRLKRAKRPLYFVLFGLMTLCFFIAQRFPMPTTTQAFELAVWLALACGMQNGLVTSVSHSVIRTTHLSGLTTDLGVGLTRVLTRSVSGEIYREEVRLNAMRASVIATFIAGSCVGFAVFSMRAEAALFIPIAISGALCACFLAAYAKPRAISE